MVEAASEGGRAARSTVFSSYNHRIACQVFQMGYEPPRPCTCVHSQPSGPRLVVVDDDHDTLDRVFTFLKAHVPNAIVLPFPETGEAMAAMAVTRPDIIFADYRMPGMDGVEFLRLAHALAPDAHQVLMTGRKREDVLPAPSAATQILLKPFDPAGLLAVLDGCLAR